VCNEPMLSEQPHIHAEELRGGAQQGYVMVDAVVIAAQDARLTALREVLEAVDGLSLDPAYSTHHKHGFAMCQSMTRVLLDAMIIKQEGK
jgi:hypothetical protein